MPSPIAPNYYGVYGPWGFDNSGTPAPMNIYQAPYFSFGPYPSTATIANSPDGTIGMSYGSLLFDEAPNLWADSMLSAGVLSAAGRGNLDYLY